MNSAAYIPTRIIPIDPQNLIKKAATGIQPSNNAREILNDQRRGIHRSDRLLKIAMRPNETELSDRHRERAWPRVKLI